MATEKQDKLAGKYKPFAYAMPPKQTLTNNNGAVHVRSVDMVRRMFIQFAKMGD